MPNHCSNDLYVSGPNKEVQRFLDSVVRIDEDGGAVLNAEAVMPYPKRFKELDEAAKVWQERFKEARELAKAINPEFDHSMFHAAYIAEHGNWPSDGFNSGGYEWCLNNWGTKWGAYNGAPLKTRKNGSVKLTFETAWGPFNETFFDTLAEMFPPLTITNKFFEQGMAFKGHIKCEKGKVVDIQSSPYKGNRGG